MILSIAGEKEGEGAAWSLATDMQPIPAAAAGAEPSHFPPVETALHAPINTGIAQSLDAVLAQFLSSMQR